MANLRVLNNIIFEYIFIFSHIFSFKYPLTALPTPTMLWPLEMILKEWEISDRAREVLKGEGIGGCKRETDTCKKNKNGKLNRKKESNKITK